jgi:hypothetical protein
VQYILPVDSAVTSMSSFVKTNADDVAIATIRTLAVDVVGKANSGHPGIKIYFISFFTAQNPQIHFRCTYGHGASDAYFVLSVSLSILDAYCILQYTLQVLQCESQELQVVQSRSICLVQWVSTPSFPTQSFI